MRHKTRDQQSRDNVPGEDCWSAFWRQGSRHGVVGVLKEDLRVDRRYLEDLRDKERLQCQPVVMTREAIIRFAQEFDPQPFHIDEHTASASFFGGLIASSLHTLAACTRAVVDAQGSIAILSGVGMHEVEMHNPVRPGDVLSVDAQWTDMQRSLSKPDRGFASIRCKVTNQRGEHVIEYGYRYLVACRGFEIPRA